MIGQTKLLRRLIMSALRPLTGTRAVATATLNVKTGQTEDVRVPKGCFCYPIPESAAGVGDVDDQRMLRTAEEVIVPVGAAKTVNMTSVLGGKRFNALKAGTKLLWDPPVAGLEIQSVLATDMAGGLDPPPEHQAPIEDVTSFGEITTASVAQDLFMARLQGRVPAVVIQWDTSDETEAKGRSNHHTPERFNIYVVVENFKGEMARRDQGTDILDAVRDLLVDKQTVDGLPLSDPPTVVFRRRRFPPTDTSQVFVLQLEVHTTASKIDLRTRPLPPGFVGEGEFADWETTRYNLGTTDGAPIVQDAVYNQAQGGFDTGFSNGFEI